MCLLYKVIVLGVVVVVHALESEIENGRMNACRSEEAGEVEKREWKHY